MDELAEIEAHAVDLDEPLPPDLRIEALRADGWSDKAQTYSAFCQQCNNAAGLMVREDAVVCLGCLVWGHPSFAEYNPGEAYDPEDYARRQRYAPYALWWLSQAEHIAVMARGGSEHLPEYIQRELRSMLGRPLRGRLWTPVTIDNTLEVPQRHFEETVLGRYLQECGGIVIRRVDVAALGQMPGTVTDFELRRSL